MGDILLDHVSFTYKNGYEAVSDITLSIRQGERVAILGQNGAGKTTTVKMMNNLQRPTKGTVMVGDKNTKGLYHRTDIERGRVCISESGRSDFSCNRAGRSRIWPAQSPGAFGRGNTEDAANERWN